MSPLTRLDIFMVMIYVVFWVVMPCSVMVWYQCVRRSCCWSEDDGGSMALQNVGILPHQYMVLIQNTTTDMYPICHENVIQLSCIEFPYLFWEYFSFYAFPLKNRCRF
jgi:hypothetical protein